MRRITLLAALALLLAPVGAHAAGETLTLALDDADVTWHEDVAATGDLAPATPDAVVHVLVDGAEVATAVTDAAGHWAATFEARRSGTVTARVDGLAESPPAALAVRPLVRIRIVRAEAWRRAIIDVRVSPSTWTGRITVRTLRGTRRITARRVRVRGGRVRVQLSSPGLDRLRAQADVPAIDGFAAVVTTRSFRPAGRRLVAGMRGGDVRALTRELRRLGFRTPTASLVYTRELGDAVVAFQKAYRLPRTYVVDGDDWRRLRVAKRIRPRLRSPRRHIEIDKTRQILLVVERGRVAWILPTSTGATGNTPEGRHRVRWKAPSTRTWLGSAILYRTLTFKGNEFAIHGFPSVPPYPASHGCARIPIWLADWLYRRTPVGEPVIVYR